MKNKKLPSLLLAFILGVVVGTPMINFAYSKLIKNIEVTSNINIEVDGKKFIPTDVNGKKVEVFIYNGTTYVPIRAISTLYKSEINWDQQNRTVKLNLNGKNSKPDKIENNLQNIENNKYKVDILRIERNFEKYENMSKSNLADNPINKTLNQISKRTTMEEITSLKQLKNHQLIKNNLRDKEAILNYSNEDFKNNKLFIGYIKENSGSIRLKANRLTKQNNNLALKVQEIRPEEGTCDMAYYVVILRVDKSITNYNQVLLDLFSK